MTTSGDTDRPVSRDDIERSLVARLADRVERHGARVALRDEQQTVSYRDLGSRVSAVANVIVSRETPGPVAVLLDHGTDAVIAFLGIVAAGRPYVPLDPTYPSEHLRKMLAHSEASLVLTSDAHLALFRELATAVEVLDFATIAMDGSHNQLATLASRSTADSHACILYTSGSTGAPKGTVHTHRTIQHLIWSHVQSYGLGPDDHLALVFSTSFAASLSELFGAVLTGASLSLTSAKRTGNLAEWIRRERITALKLPVSLFRVFLRALDDAAAADFPDTRLVLLGGDALFRKDVEKFRAHFSERCLLVNRLTSTESLSITRYPIDRALRLDADVVPVGYPDYDTDVRILDEAGNPMPAGELGQIVVRSKYLSPGYWRDDHQTRATFVPGPDGSVTMRTGDLGRLRPDGCLEHFGRGDQQVKVRGHRVEMAAVEAALNAVDAVKEAAVVVQTTEGEGEGKRLVGYVVPRGTTNLSANALRAVLARSLPDYMIPSVFVSLARLPTTATGKIDRRALPSPASVRPLVDGAFVPARSAAEQQLSAIWTSVLGLDTVGVNDNFFDLGGDSLLLLRVHARLREATGSEVPIVDLFTHPTVAALAAHLAQVPPGRESTGVRHTSHDRSHDIAIIGMAGVFPGARDLAEYWANLRAGIESIRSLSDDELIAAGVSREELADPDYVRTVPELPELRRFDAEFFGLSPSEAAILDPQHRLLLEVTWHALESAGCSPEKLSGRVGVFVGAPQSAYLQQHLLPQREQLASASDLQLRLACDPEFLATRIAYKLNLKGPALNVATACSTALVAVHLACRSLQNGECEVAVAGGASVESPELCGYRYQEGWITSRDGHCRPFDAKAQGTVFGSGAGIVVLKPLARALADGDHISAVIRGSAVNNDGSHKVGFAAPSMEGQVAVLAAAQADAGLAGYAIDYVETHGTGTALGDPIEIAALTRAFGEARPGSIAIGSVKANIGHLSRAAGIAGLIKTVLALEHRELPPSLNFERPNPQIDFASSPFFVNTELRPWPPSAGRVRRAAVSSFGVGGTNAHVILEEAPPEATAEASKPWQLLTLSAKSETALAASSVALLETVSTGASELADLAWTLQTGRSDHAFRHSLVCRDRDDARAKLAAFPDSGFAPHRYHGSAPSVVFMFPGQGAQYPGMAAGLYADEPSFRADVDFCADLLTRELDFDLRQILYAREHGDESAALLRQTRITQPALFVTEWAMARLLMRWGIHPDAMIGHSIGEHTAACLAGVISVEATLSLIARRGRLIQSLPAGHMLVVHLPESEASALCDEKISLAAVNAPGLCVLAGPEAAIDELAQRLVATEIDHHLLHTSHAFHSWMMDPALADFTAELSRHQAAPPRIPYLSGVTGTWITPAEAMVPDYWSRLLRGTVRFSDGLRTLAGLPEAVLVEVGPGASLSALARLHPELASCSTVSSLRSARDVRTDREVLLQGLGQLWLRGVHIDWSAVHASDRRRRVPLPGYPFERTLHWVPRPQRRESPATEPIILPGGIGFSVASPAPAVAPLQPLSLRERVQSASAHDRAALLRAHLARTINTLLGHEPSHPIDSDRPLVDLGIDSLACIRLVQQLLRDLGVSTPVRAMLAATIESLAVTLGAQVPACA